jgi:phosphate acetyltransferase
MRLIGRILEKLQRRPKRIVFPEGDEPRIIQAARQFRSLQLGAPLLLGDRTRIKDIAERLNVPLHGIRILNYLESEDFDRFVEKFTEIRKEKGMTRDQAAELMRNPNYYGAMMVADHYADGMVSGAKETSGSVLRPMFQILKTAPYISTASSCMVMELEDTKHGENGILLLADCGVIPEPTPSELADIAVSTAQLAVRILNIRPRVALLSFSTRGSADHPSVSKVQLATQMAWQKAKTLGLDADFDGELQLDAALAEEVASRKLPHSLVAGKANVLIFPDLNSGNIAYKLLQHVARANAYGQILLGLGGNAADVSRGSNAHDILGVATIVGIQSIADRAAGDEDAEDMDTDTGMF